MTLQADVGLNHLEADLGLSGVKVARAALCGARKIEADALHAAE
jgi:hypothetical protein